MSAADAKIKIFDAITQLFNEGGVEDVTMANIGARCGLHKSSLVYYFSTKEEMLRAYYEYYLEEHDKAFFNDIQAFIESHDKTPESFVALVDRITASSDSAPSLSDIASADIIYLATKNPGLKALLNKKFKRMADYFYELFQSYLACGIFEESRYEQSICDLLLLLSSILYLILYDMRLPHHDDTVRRAAENVKRSFLKDDIYRRLAQ